MKSLLQLFRNRPSVRPPMTPSSKPPPGMTSAQQALYASEQAAHLRLMLAEYAIISEAIYLAARYQQGQATDLRTLALLVTQREQCGQTHREAAAAYTAALKSDVVGATRQMDWESYDA